MDKTLESWMGKKIAEMDKPELIGLVGKLANLYEDERLKNHLSTLSAFTGTRTMLSNGCAREQAGRSWDKPQTDDADTLVAL